MDWGCVLYSFFVKHIVSASLVSFKMLITNLVCGPVSVVGIATAYGLGGPGIESWWR